MFDDIYMRTTLSLEPDVALKIKERMAEEQNESMKDIINRALRIGLHPLGLRPGLDPDKLNQLLDDIEVEERVEKINAHS